MVHLKIGGVPEHFNSPWLQTKDSQTLKDQDVSYDWTSVAGGTGAMYKALAAKELDMALLLTEGAVKFATEDPNIKIAGFYVSTPLQWGIFVANEGPIKNVSELQGATVSISNWGSGSHLMAAYLAEKDNLGTVQYAKHDNITGMVNGVKSNEAQVFLWDRFMTSVYVENGDLRRIGVCPTPWPAFVFVARTEVLEDSEKRKALSTIVKTVMAQCETFKKDEDKAVDYIVDNYKLKPAVAREWCQNTTYSKADAITENLSETIDLATETLTRLGLLKEKRDGITFNLDA
eukprot:Clim_evm10s3 gene=Clim_evmTU10s3